MSSQKYTVSAPPNEKGLFRVVYEIDVSADNEKKAAETAWRLMRFEDAFEPVMMVIDRKGNQTKLDLSDYVEFSKVTTGFVIQSYRRDKDGKYHCTGQEFIAGDDVQFENLKGEPIEKPDHEYQPFNMTLLSRDEIIDRLKFLLDSIDVGGEQSRQFSNEIAAIRDLINDLGSSTIDQKSDTGPPHNELLEACKVLVSYTMDLLQRLDNQVNLDDVEELQQARDAIDTCENTHS